MANTASKRTLEQLEKKATESPRAKQRLGTIGRVVAACDAIESGEAVQVIKKALGRDYGLRSNPEISPSTVARYIEAMQKLHRADWPGPKRPTIQSDADLKAYVDAREAERVKPITPKKKTSHREQIEDAIDSLPRAADRALLREAFANLRAAKRENDELSKILKEISPLDFDKLRDGLLVGNREVSPEDDISTELLSEKDFTTLRQLIDRMADVDALSRVGMESHKGRIRHKRTGRVLIEKDELKCLELLIAPSAPS